MSSKSAIIPSGLTNQTRPQILDDVIGLENLKSVLDTTVKGCKARGQPIPSILITGPAGCSKSTVGRIIANMTGGKLYLKMGSDFNKESDIRDFAGICKDGDVVFIDEAHTVGGGSAKSKIIQTCWYDWIEEGKIGDAPAPRVTFVFATTNPGRLTPSLRNRCLLLNTNFFSIDEMAQILLQAGKKVKLDLSTSTEGLLMLAQSSRGVPRIAVMSRLESLLNHMAAKKIKTFTTQVAQEFLSAFGIDTLGLDDQDRKYLNTLYEKIVDHRGKGVSLNTMTQATGFAEDMVRHQIEGYLLRCGLIMITGQGRTVTDKGCKAIGKPAPTQLVINEINRKIVDKDFIKVWCEQISKKPKTGERNIGMRPLMEAVRWNYMDPVQRKEMLSIIQELGYTSRQRGGIVPLQQNLESNATTH